MIMMMIMVLINNDHHHDHKLSEVYQYEISDMQVNKSQN